MHLNIRQAQKISNEININATVITLFKVFSLYIPFPLAANVIVELKLHNTIK